MTKRVPLPLVPRELARLTGQRSPSYCKVYLTALDQKIPAERQENGRWDVDDADMPLIAEAFVLSVASPAIAA